MQKEKIKGRLATPAELKEGAEIRRQAAEGFGVRPSFIRLKECVQTAMGKQRVVSDFTGCRLDWAGAAFNKYIYSQECPIVLNGRENFNELAYAMATSVEQARSHVGFLESEGFVEDCYGWKHVVDAKRPYSNEIK